MRRRTAPPSCSAAARFPAPATWDRPADGGSGSGRRADEFHKACLALSQATQYAKGQLETLLDARRLPDAILREAERKWLPESLRCEQRLGMHLDHDKDRNAPAKDAKVQGSQWHP